MRRHDRLPTSTTKLDMTPMIDMTFQLIAFFMVLINFAAADQNERIRLPISELAKPPDTPLMSPITLQLTKQGTVLLAGQETPIEGLRRLLQQEKKAISETSEAGPKAATIVIRADRDAQTGKVQEVIRVCQETGFEKFDLRAKQEEKI
jgi:biopolymer transport protein ExbD